MGYRFIEFLNEEEMLALNTMCEETSSPDHLRTNREMKRLDYFVADTWLRRRFMTARVHPCRSVVFESNHRKLMA